MQDLSQSVHQQLAVLQIERTSRFDVWLPQQIEEGDAAYSIVSLQRFDISIERDTYQLLTCTATEQCNMHSSTVPVRVITERYLVDRSGETLQSVTISYNQTSLMAFMRWFCFFRLAMTSSGSMYRRSVRAMYFIPLVTALPSCTKVPAVSP